MIPELTYPLDAAMGDVAGDGTDGCRRTDFTGVEMEFDREDVSRPEGKQDGQQTIFPMQYVVIGSIVMTVVICVVQYFSMGIPVYLSFIAIILSLPLMLVGLRVLGETNWGPISAMSNMMQAIFAFISPGNVPVNMSSSGLTGTIAVTSEALMQDFKAGQLLKSNPRSLTIAQLIAAPVGSMATAIVYPILRDKFGIGDRDYRRPSASNGRASLNC